MLFQESFKTRIREGTVSLTFRSWESAQAVAGQSYRLGPDDAVEVTAVDAVALGSITVAQARRAGFDNVAELREMLKSTSKAPLNARSRVYRISFRHAMHADPRIARREDISEAALDEVTGRLERMDALSRRGPWTQEALRLIADYPEVAASMLAPHMNRETRAFKADIRKLKELGLTVSHQVGYSLSTRGKALLSRLEQEDS